MDDVKMWSVDPRMVFAVSTKNHLNSEATLYKLKQTFLNLKKL